MLMTSEFPDINLISSYDAIDYNSDLLCYNLKKNDS